MILLLLALIPALVVLFYYYNKDHHPEPWGWVLAVFLFGAASLVVVLPQEAWAQRYTLHENEPTVSALLWESLLIPGLIEEMVKMLVVVLAIFWREEFDEPVDGLIYGTAAALGFTFAEDWYCYVYRNEDWTRVFSMFAHPWFSCFWAAALGWAKFRPARIGIPILLLGLVASVCAHGLYDFLVLASRAREAWAWLRYFVAPLMIVLYFVLEHQLEHANVAGKSGA